MKKAILVLLTFFVLFFGTIVFFCVYNYDKIHFGDELLMYSDAKAEGYPVTFSCGEDTAEVSGYWKTELYRIIIRGQGTRKRLMFRVKCTEAPYVFTFGDEYRISVYPCEGEDDDTVYYLYEDLRRGKKKHYTVSKMKTWTHLTELIYGDESE